MTERDRLPDRRPAETFVIKHGRLPEFIYTITLGSRDDGTIAEVFASGPKVGETIDALARDGAVLISLALQYGAPIDTIAKALTREEDGYPSTVVGALADLILKEGRA